jgi:hypothetical protein
VVDDGRDGSRPRRSGTRAAVLVAFLIAEAVTVIGAAIGFRVHGYALPSILWLLPGIAALLWAVTRFERWRGRELPIFLGRLFIVGLFIPGIAFGDWLQDTVR